MVAEHGYFRLKKDMGGPGQCGVAMKASYPVKSDHDDPAVPTICDAQCAPSASAAAASAHGCVQL